MTHIVNPESVSQWMGYPTGQGASKAMLKAIFATAGYLVHDGCDGDFFVVRADWGMSRHCGDLAALAAFGRKVRVISDRSERGRYEL